MSKKLNSIIIPHIEFRDATIREAIEVLREQAAENDTGPEGQRGVNIVLRLVPLGQIAPAACPPVPAFPEGTGTPGAGGPPPLAAPAPAAPAGNTRRARPVRVERQLSRPQWARQVRASL